MEIELHHRPGSAAARLVFKQGETIVSEGGAMISMSSDFDVVTSTRKRSGGSIKAGLKRMLSGESFFLNHFTAKRDGVELWLAPPLMGDLEVLSSREGRKLTVQGGSFVACTEQVEINLGWQGLKSIFSGEGLFWVEATGSGPLLVNSFGCIYPVDVQGSYVVDSGHIVAFEDTLSFTVTKAGKSWLSSFLGGEGFVCKFEGSGRLWCQSHHPPNFGSLLGPKLKAR